jgi:hypothetical protein
MAAARQLPLAARRPQEPIATRAGDLLPPPAAPSRRHRHLAAAADAAHPRRRAFMSSRPAGPLFATDTARGGARAGGAPLKQRPTPSAFSGSSTIEQGKVELDRWLAPAAVTRRRQAWGAGVKKRLAALVSAWEGCGRWRGKEGYAMVR